MRSKFNAWIGVCFCALATIAADIRAQVTDAQLKALGLETAWLSQVRLPLKGQGIASIDLWMDGGDIRKYAVVDLPTGALIQVNAKRLDAKNQAIGIERAKSDAISIAAKLLGQSTGIEAAEVNVPRVNLVVTTSTGLVQNFDAETGKLLWATPCGSISKKALPAALCKMGVVIIQGDQLYLLDWVTGKQILNKHLASSTSRTVGVVEGHVPPPPGVERAATINPIALVGDYAGSVTGIPLSKPEDLWYSRLVGASSDRPVNSPDGRHLAITTNAGMVYFVTGSNHPKINHRYESASGVSSSVAFGTDACYVGNRGGVLAKLDPEGRVIWRFYLSHAIDTPAMIDSEAGLVFVTSESGELTALEIATGAPAWPTSAHIAARSSVALSGDNLICRTSDDRLVAIDKRTGVVRGATVNLPLLPYLHTNEFTDRVYLIGVQGQLQCLRPIGRTLPKTLRPIDVAPRSQTQRSEAGAGSGDTERPAEPSRDGPSFDKPSGEDTADPFSDPFGNEAESSTDGPMNSSEDDPFGAANQ